MPLLRMSKKKNGAQTLNNKRLQVAFTHARVHMGALFP